MPYVLEVSLSGFGYPLSDLRPSSLPVSPQLRSWAFPFRAFLLLRGRKKGLPSLLYVPALSHKTLWASCRRSNVSPPTQKAVPSFCLQRFRSDPGLCSLGPSRLSGPLVDVNQEKASSSLFPSPFRSLKSKTSQPYIPGALGCLRLHQLSFFLLFAFANQGR